MEDEIHFLIDCETYRVNRKPLFEQCIGLKPQFNYFTSKEKFILIMTSPLLVDIAAQYLIPAFATRDAAILLKEVVNKVVDIENTS